MIAFLHTSPIHISTFDGLLNELATNTQSHHIVDEDLLTTARTTGLTADLQTRVNAYIDQLTAQGATQIVCTCSTIGELAEQAPVPTNVSVIRVDRPMAEKAVTNGRNILIFATLASTLAPTKHLLEQTAADLNQEVVLKMILCEEAWSFFEQGDHESYLQAIAQTVRAHATAGDVAVLAQASMAAAADLCTDLNLPILSSPRTAVLHLLRQ